MPSDATRKLLKVFGIAVTDFEDQAEALLERAEALKGRGAVPGEVVALLEEAIRAVTMLMEHWGEVERHLQESQRKVLGAARAVVEAGRRKP